MSEARTADNGRRSRTRNGELLRLRVSARALPCASAALARAAGGSRAARPGARRISIRPEAILAGSKPTAGSVMLEELRATGALGMWRDRNDIKDSSQFARELRRRAQAQADREVAAG